MRRTQVSEFAWRTDIEHSDLLTVDHPARKKGYRLVFGDQKKLGITVVRLGKPYVREDIYRPGGERLVVLRKDDISEEMREEPLRLLQTVNGNPSNRPSIIGEKARQYGVRKDGLVSPRIRVPDAVIEKFGGRADMLGHFRWRNGECDITNWTRQKPHIYLGVLPFVAKVNEVYKNTCPSEYARQMAYVETIPENRRIPGTAFTTLYALKNAPTATHVDDFDYPGGFGCMASLGNFRGGWLCFPRFRIAIDYQPGDVVLADVHQLHANFPIYEGDLRVACVFFCRKGQHKCGV